MCYYCGEPAAGILTLQSESGNQLSVNACNTCAEDLLNRQMEAFEPVEGHFNEDSRLLLREGTD